MQQEPRRTLRSRAKVLLDRILLGSGTKAQQVSQYLQQDVDALAELAAYTERVLDETVHEDVAYAYAAIRYWLEHTTDKMELVQLSLALQNQLADMRGAGAMLAPGRYACVRCKASFTVTEVTRLAPCPQCDCVFASACHTLGD